MAKTTKSSRKETSSPVSSPEQQIEEVTGLIRLMSETGLAELELETPQLKVSLRKHAQVVVSPASLAVSPVSQPMPMPVTAASASVSVKPRTDAEKKDILADTKYHKIMSPMAGTFYAAPSPNSAPYVKEGDDIQAGQPVCIVEAMKLMNEIKADKTGKIMKVLAKNAQPVEKGTVLFHVELKA